MPGSGRVAVVTDSTAGVGDGGAVRVVPLHVVVDDLSYAEGRSITPEEVGRHLRAGRRVTTSRPAPGEFTTRYERLAAEGVDAVVSVHLSAEISGTVEAAELAAAQAPLPVTVLDSRIVGAALGLAVRDAAAVAADGGTVEAVLAAARARATASTTLFCVDSLEWLRRGGRISGARALVGTALAVRPVLGLLDGRIELVEKVRTTARALARVQELAGAAIAAAPGPVDLVVQHLDAPERAEQVRAALAAVEAPHGLTTAVSTVGAVIGAHCGPGTLGVIVAPVTPDTTG